MNHPNTPSGTPSPTTWSGDVVRVRGFSHQGKPMRVAAWVDPWRRVLAAAIVDGNGPAVLRRLLDDLLAEGPKTPGTVQVPPTARGRFQDLEGPAVQVEKDAAVGVMIEDQACAGLLPRGLPVVRGS